MQVYVNGTPVAGRMVTKRVRRWRWVPKWIMRWSFFTQQWKSYELDAPPESGASVVVMYDDNGVM